MPVRLYFILGVALLSVSSTSLVIRHLVDTPAFTIAFWRMFIASAFLWGYSSVKKKKSLSKTNLKLTIFAGFFLGLHFSCFFWGVKNTSIANATLLANTGPFFTALFAFFSGIKLKKHVLFGLAIAFLGLLIVQVSKFDNVTSSHIGNFVSLLSGFCIAITYSYAKKIRKETDTLIYGRSLFFFASVAILFIGLFFKEHPFPFKVEHLFWFLFLGIVPSILGHNLLNYSIRYLSPTAVASVPLGEPIIASFFAYFIFYEFIPMGAFIGGPFIFIGLFLILTNQKE